MNQRLRWSPPDAVYTPIDVTSVAWPVALRSPWLRWKSQFAESGWREERGEPISGRLPNFLIIGAQKAGTTFVHHCLMEHPDVFMPEGEIPFFENPDYSETGIESLERLFDGREQAKGRGIKRPSYLHLAECPERIHKQIPDAKLIAILRDPIERAVSGYYHQSFMGFAPVKDVNRGLPEIIEGRHEKRYPRASQIIDFGFYHRHLTHYLRYFEKDQLLVILHDDIKRSPLNALKTTFRFLGVSEDYSPKSLTSRPMATVYSLARLRFLTLRNRLAYDYSADRMRLFPKNNYSRFESRVLRWINGIDRKFLSKWFRHARPALDQDTLQMLRSIYAEDTRALQDQLGVSLGHWKVLSSDI